MINITFLNEALCKCVRTVPNPSLTLPATLFINYLYEKDQSLQADWLIPSWPESKYSVGSTVSDSAPPPCCQAPCVLLGSTLLSWGREGTDHIDPSATHVLALNNNKTRAMACLLPIFASDYQPARGHTDRSLLISNQSRVAPIDLCVILRKALN